MNTLHKVSIFMASKNRERILCRAIESVFNQDYSNIELVVVDDGSTDSTLEILSQYQKTHSNFKYVHNEESVGVAAARNIAIANTTGEFITGLDDDDFFLPNRISSLVAAYSDQYAFICSATVWDWGVRQKVADGSAKLFGLQAQLSYNHASTQVLVKRERMLAIGGFDESLVARIDYDAWTRLIEMFGSAKRIPVATYVLTRDEGVQRVTATDRNIKGNHQFMAKHSHKMNWRNIKNQEFWDIYARNAKLTFPGLIIQFAAGHLLIKLKYYIKTQLRRF